MGHWALEIEKRQGRQGRRGITEKDLFNNSSLSPLSPLSLLPTPLHLLLDPRVPIPKEFDFLHGVPVTLSSFASAIDLHD